MQVKEELFLALLVVTLLLVASYTITLGLTNFSSHNKASEKLQPSTADAGGREGSEVSSDSLDKYQKKWDNVGFLPTPINCTKPKYQKRKMVDRPSFFSQRNPKTDYVALL